MTRPPLSPGKSKSKTHHSSSSSSEQQRQQQQQQQLVAAKPKSVKHASALLHEREAQITALQTEVNALTNKLAGLNAASVRSGHTRRLLRPQLSKRRLKLPAYGTVIQSESSSDPKRSGRLSVRGRPQLITNKRAHMGRNASIATANVLASLPDDHDEPLYYIPNPRIRDETRCIIDRIQSMFKDPSSGHHMSYLRSAQFASDVLKLNRQAVHVLEEEPRVAFLQSPCYVFGDIHGNLEDLHFFSDNIWRLGMALTAGNFVFLGDYVDRGMSCLEVIAYLVSMKLLLPHKVTLLRGNHETRDVNGWEEHYGARSFIHQCQERFGDDVGYRVWESTNQVFDRLPLSAVIDQDIFCVHGGIPRPVPSSSSAAAAEGGGSSSSRIQDILGVPKVAGINPPYEHEEETYQQIASDCIWSDPASDEQEMHGVDPHSGFGESLRGGGAICFGHKAVTDFLAQQGFSYIMRAHEAHADGVAVSKGARVFTVFSTSKDHNQGSHAMAGCILVDSEKMQVINRSPAYRNQYVHRRDSVSLAMLSESEINQRIELGLVTMDHPENGDEDDQYDVEEWDDFEDVEEGQENNEEEEMHYVIDTRRSSAVDPSSTVASPQGSSHDNHEHGLFGGGGGGTDDAGGAAAASSSARKRFDFGGSATSTSSNGSDEFRRMSALQEEEDDIEEDDDEDSTVDGGEGEGEGAEAMMMVEGDSFDEDDADEQQGGDNGGGGRGAPLREATTTTINFSSSLKNVSSRHRKVVKARREYSRDSF